MVVSVTLLVGCSERKESQHSNNTAEREISRQIADLENLMSHLQSATFTNDLETATQLAKELFPDDATLKVACSPENHPEEYGQILNWIEKNKPNRDQDYLKIFSFKQWQTQISVSTMTGKELAQTQNSSGFDTRAHELARDGVLRESTRYYSVEFKKPLDQVGRRFELFLKDGQSWKMLGPVWRALSTR